MFHNILVAIDGSPAAELAWPECPSDRHATLLPGPAPTPRHALGASVDSLESADG
jgi:hypothetical protein